MRTPGQVGRLLWITSLAAGCGGDAAGPPEPGPIRVDTLLTGLHYPSEIGLSDGAVYLIESGARSSGVGGDVRLVKYDLGTQQSQLLINQPTRTRGLVVEGPTRMYLANFTGTSPGETGSFGRADLSNGTWTESHVLDVAVAASDIFRDTNGDMYLVGMSDKPTGSSMYRFTGPDYASGATIIGTGLGRVAAMTKAGSDIYYSRVAVDVGIYRMRNGATERIVPGISIFSLATDGTWLYFGSFGALGRMHLTSLAVDTLVSGEASVGSIRYDGTSRRLYYTTVGTSLHQYRDGKLKVLVNLPQ
jgi:hypothetical protein